MKPFSGSISLLFFSSSLLFMLLLPGCRASDRADGGWILAAGEFQVSLKEYRDTYEIAKMAYVHNILQDAGVRRALHRRVIHDLGEALFLQAAAWETGIEISKTVLDEAVAEIRGFYPEEVFRQMLAESAISERAWESALRRRLLMERIAEKIVDRELEITPEALRVCFLEYCESLGKKPEEVPLTEALAEILVARFRNQESEEVYGRWLQGMRERMSVRINYALLHEVFPETRPLMAESGERGGGEMQPRDPVLGEDMHEEAGLIQ